MFGMDQQFCSPFRQAFNDGDFQAIALSYSYWHEYVLGSSFTMTGLGFRVIKKIELFVPLKRAQSQLSHDVSYKKIRQV